MPSGYTEKVQSGEITDLAGFVWRCAREMGALIGMRHDSLDAPIPERFEPDTQWHEDQLAAARERLAGIVWTTRDEISEMQRADYEQAVIDAAERGARRAIRAERYEKMIAAVAEWEPPSPDHEGLKTFMLNQLQDSLKMDCWPVAEPHRDPRPVTQYKVDQILKCQKDIDYHTKGIAEETERVEARNDWLRVLRESIPQPATPDQ